MEATYGKVTPASTVAKAFGSFGVAALPVFSLWIIGASDRGVKVKISLE